jgi:hypothetical protein
MIEYDLDLRRDIEGIKDLDPHILYATFVA